MPIISCYVSDETMWQLQECARDLGRDPVELAEAAISNETCRAYADLRARYGLVELREKRHAK